MKVGLISDTHGVVDAAVAPYFSECDAILHAGDVGHHGGETAVLDMLRAIAPITAVRGNVDDSCPSLPTHALATLGGYTVLVLHIVKCSKTKGGVTDEAAALIRNHAPNIVVCGHSHTAELWWDTGVLFVNPGSAGPARFKQKRSIAVLTLPDESGSGERPMVEHITLSNKAPPRPRGSSRPPGKRRKVAAKE